MATTKTAAKAASPKAEKAPSTRTAKVKKTVNKDSFSIIETGGKQYLVAEGQKVRVEKILGGYQVGHEVIFDKVLLTQKGETITLGTPYIDGAKVSAEITAIGKADKVTVIKYKAKSRYFKKRGHRQPFFEVKVK